MPTKAPEKDYTSRRGELSAFGRASNSSRSLQLLILSIALLGIIFLSLAFVFREAPTGTGFLFLIALVLSAGLFLIWRYTKAHIIDPDLAFRKWIQRVCDGELESGIDLPPEHRHFKELDFHTRNLTSSLRRLSTDMETLVESQTNRLENQNRILELLFELTSDVACELDLHAVLNTVCTHLSVWLDDADTGAYMLENDNLKLFAASGPGKSVFKLHRLSTDLPDTDLDQLAASLEFTSASSVQTLKIPIFKNRDVVGMVEINVKEVPVRQESQRVFQTVSEQLSAFVLRDSALESAQDARLIKARTQLGADLHDSLAQTLLATGYKVKMLREKLGTDTDASVSHELKRIEEMINEGNAELRGLIGEYRKPLTEHRQTETIKKIIYDFNQTCNIEVFFQLDSPGILFTTREDAVIQRIVGEALNNSKKYSDATMIRVYVRMESSGARSILVEDDGKGFRISDESRNEVSPGGDHIGLSIMRDRALSIGAIISIESEPDEGTRVFLKLPPLELAEAV